MRHRFVLLIAIATVMMSGVPTSSLPAAAQNNPLAACADILADYTPVVGTEHYPTPTDVPLPPVREAWRDPSFRTCVVRVTDRQNDFDRPLPGLKNEYSRVQAFNADETLIMVRGVDGTWFLYNAQTLDPIQEVAFSLDEPRWDAQNPHRFAYSVWFDGLPQLMVADLKPVGDGFDITTTVAHDFAGELPPEWNAAAVWHKWEGSPSYDSRYDAFMVEDPDFITRGLITYDWQTGQVIGKYAVPHGELNEPEDAGMSPLGTYMLAHFEFCEQGTMGTYEEPCGPMIYTRDLTAGWGLLRIAGHGDLAVNASGREVMVYQDVENDWIAMVDLETRQVTPLFPLDFSTGVYGLHISGRASGQPGWVGVSVQPEAPTLDFNNPFWMVGTVLAVELKTNPRVIQLAHHHSIRSDAEADYFAEPQVTINHDFTRLLFTSNWGVYGTGEVEMYMIVLPDKWLEPE